MESIKYNPPSTRPVPADAEGKRTQAGLDMASAHTHSAWSVQRVCMVAVCMLIKLVCIAQVQPPS